MTIGLTLFLAAFAQATPTPAVVPVPPLAAPIRAPAPSAPRRAYSSAEKTAGMQIAAMLNSRADTDAALDKAFGPALTQTLAAQPQYASLEEKYPGITQAIGAALAADLKSAAATEIPQLWDTLGTIYAETFDEGELQKLRAFYEGSVGKTLIKGVYKGLDTQAAIKGGMADADGKATAADLEAITKPAARKAAMQLNLADQQQLVLFAMTPIGVKLTQVNPRLTAAAAAWTNQLQVKYSARIEATVVRTGSDFIAETQAASTVKKQP